MYLVKLHYTQELWVNSRCFADGVVVEDTV